MSRHWVDAPDEELIVAAVAGERDAFAALHDRLAPRVYSRFLCEFGDDAEAKDATQDTFVEMWRALPQLREPRALRGWLATIANRRAMRSNGDRALQLDPFAPHDGLAHRADPARGPDERVMQAEASQLVNDALEGLNPRYRAAVEFLLAHGHAGRDLGAALGVTPAQASRIADKATHGLADAIRALVVARMGRGDCAGLDRILGEAGWAGGPLSEDLRTTVQRHIGRCDRCQERRRSAARHVIESLPVVLPLLVPAALRDRVLGDAEAIASTQQAPASASAPRAWRPHIAALAAAAAVVVVFLAALVLRRNDDEDVTADNTRGDAPSNVDVESGSDDDLPLCSDLPGTPVDDFAGCLDPSGDVINGLLGDTCTHGRDLSMIYIDDTTYWGFDGGTWHTGPKEGQGIDCSSLPAGEAIGGGDDSAPAGIPACTDLPGRPVVDDKQCTDASGEVKTAVGFWDCPPQGLLWQTEADGIGYWGFEDDVWHSQPGPIGGCP